MRRKHYLAVYFTGFAFIVIIGLIQKATGTSLSALTFLVVAAIVPSSVRRLHDIGYSGWLIIGVMLIPLAFLLLLLAGGEPGSNAHGINPKDTSGLTSQT